MIRLEQHGPVVAIRMSHSLWGRPLYWTAAYWMDGLLIDSGPPATAAQLVSVLERYPVRCVVVTHGHEDHIGGLLHLQKRFPDAVIHAPVRTLPIIERPGKLRQQLYRRLIWGTPQPVHGVLPLEDRIATPGFTFRVIETPGHSRDHISFFEPRQRWLFCGDAFIGGEDRVCSPEFEMFGNISSLRTMAALRPERLFPGSGNVRRTALADLHNKIGQLIALCRDVARLDASGLPTGEIVRYLFGGEPPMRLWTLGHFSAANLVMACRRYNEIFASPESPVQPPHAQRTRPRKSSESRS